MELINDVMTDHLIIVYKIIYNTTLHNISNMYELNES
jgi:hypothetical protein